MHVLLDLLADVTMLGLYLMGNMVEMTYLQSGVLS